jgi:hypothetical protein
MVGRYDFLGNGFGTSFECRVIRLNQNESPAQDHAKANLHIPLTQRRGILALLTRPMHFPYLLLLPLRTFPSLGLSEHPHFVLSLDMRKSAYSSPHRALVVDRTAL